MKFEFNKVIPHPLKGSNSLAQSGWGKSFNFSSNQTILLRSKSGKGKSTFISFLFGSRNDFDGEVLIDGTSWKSRSLNEVSELRKSSLSILPQDIRLFPKLTALENLQVKNQLTNYKSEKELIELLTLFNLEEQINQVASTLSQGQQQRVGIIRSTLQPFQFLILDEPFSHIDQENIEIAKRIITEACALNNAGFLISSLGPDYGLNINQTIEL